MACDAITSRNTPGKDGRGAYIFQPCQMGQVRAKVPDGIDCLGFIYSYGIHAHFTPPLWLRLSLG
jgi:hypothetical protein